MLAVDFSASVSGRGAQAEEQIVANPGSRFRVYLEGQGNLVYRFMIRMTGFTIRVIGVIYLFTSRV